MEDGLNMFLFICIYTT